MWLTVQSASLSRFSFSSVSQSHSLSLLTQFIVRVSVSSGWYLDTPQTKLQYFPSIFFFSNSLLINHLAILTSVHTMWNNLKVVTQTLRKNTVNDVTNVYKMADCYYQHTDSNASSNKCLTGQIFWVTQTDKKLGKRQSLHGIRIKYNGVKIHLMFWRLSYIETSSQNLDPLEVRRRMLKLLPQKREMFSTLGCVITPYSHHGALSFLRS